MIEVVSMSTVRISILSLIRFEDQLLNTYVANKNFMGEYACSKTIAQLTAVLNALEHYKTVEKTEKEIA